MKLLIKSRKPRNQAGFTIAELLIATAVFSVVLLAALAAFLGVGHLFYKGVSLTSTQNAATQVLNDMSNSVQSASFVSSPALSNGYIYTCIGNTRYTYTISTANGAAVMASDGGGLTAGGLQNGDHGGNFGLLKDTLAGSTTCSPPCAPGGGCADPLNPNTSVEMLGQNMRVENLFITGANCSSSTLYNINLWVAYGDNSVFNYSNGPASPCGGVAPNKTLTCAGGQSSQAFCAVVNLSTTISSGTS